MSEIIDVSASIIIKIEVTRSELLNVLTCSIISVSEIGFTRIAFLP